MVNGTLCKSAEEVLDNVMLPCMCICLKKSNAACSPVNCVNLICICRMSQRCVNVIVKY